MLAPCEDLPFQRKKFQRDLTTATGVPFKTGIGHKSDNADEVWINMASGLLSAISMHEHCRHLQYLPTVVYPTICNNPPEDAVFKVNPNAPPGGADDSGLQGAAGHLGATR